MIVRRVEALGRFLETDDGANLLTGVKRAQNILRIEEKKDAATIPANPTPGSMPNRRKRRSPSPSTR